MCIDIMHIGILGYTIVFSFVLVQASHDHDFDAVDFRASVSPYGPGLGRLSLGLQGSGGAKRRQFLLGYVVSG